jgi:glycosyltransferase involved in cell wall biosynthesis
MIMRAVQARPLGKPTVSIVVPARNEARNLEVVLPTLPKDAEIIVVDGHSVDGSAEVVARVRPDARFVQQTRRGKGNALVVGFAEATGDIVVMFDADGSADAAEIARFVATLSAGADFAKGSRVLAGGGSVDITPIRDLGNRFLTLLTNIAFRTRYTDLCYGYNAFWADVLDDLELPLPHPVSGDMQWGDGFEIETLINCRVAVAKLVVAEVPSVELERLHGSSNLHAVKDGLRVLRTLTTERLRSWRANSASRNAGRVGLSVVSPVTDSWRIRTAPTQSGRPEIQLPKEASA